MYKYSPLNGMLIKRKKVHECDASHPHMFRNAQLPLQTTLNRPLVSKDDVEIHLDLLLAFYAMRARVLGSYDVQTSKKTPAHELVGAPSAGGDVWMAFLHRAVYRFECYVTRILAQINHGHDRSIQDLNYSNMKPAEITARCPSFENVPESALPPLDVAMVWRTFFRN